MTSGRETAVVLDVLLHQLANLFGQRGDGIGDVIVSTPPGFFSGEDGESFVVFGSATGFAPSIDLGSLDGTNGFRLVGAGGQVAGAGDVNGDGIDDLFVGAKFEYSNGRQNGAGYVVFGSMAGFAPAFDVRTLNGSNGFKLTGERAYDFAGTSVASAGDINGDGFEDLIVGAWAADVPNGYNSGVAYVVYGKASGFAANIQLSSLDGSNGFKMLGAAAGNGGTRTRSGS